MQVKIYEARDPRLGRHVVHDDQSWQYRVQMTRPVLHTVTHERRNPIFDQGQVGSCTANALLGLLVTEPFYIEGRDFTEEDALNVYHEETMIDDRQIPGHFPPDDTGSAGIYSMKVAKAHKWIKLYRHIFSTQTVLGALVTRPVSIGIPWYAHMFDPDKNGFVEPTGQIVGGHQLVLDAMDAEHHFVRFANSWGEGWGKDGWGFMSFEALDALLGNYGDAVVPAMM